MDRKKVEDIILEEITDSPTINEIKDSVAEDSKESEKPPSSKMEVVTGEESSSQYKEAEDVPPKQMPLISCSKLSAAQKEEEPEPMDTDDKDVSSSNQVDKPKANDINDNEEDFQGFDPPAEDDLCKKFIKALNEIIESIPRKADDSADLDLQRKSDESDVKPKGYIINEAESNAVVNKGEYTQGLLIAPTSAKKTPRSVKKRLIVDLSNPEFRKPFEYKRRIIREAKSKPGPCGTDQMPLISCSKLSAAQKEEEPEPMDTDDKDVSSSNQVDKPKANDINDNEEDFQGFDPPAEDDLCKKFIKALNEIIESIPRKADDSADLDLQRKSDESDVKPKGYIINEAESNAVVNKGEYTQGLLIAPTSAKKTPRSVKKRLIVDLSNPEFRKPFEYVSGRELTIDETSFREPIALKKEIIREAKSKPGPCGTDQMPSISCSKLSAAQKEEEPEPMDTDDKDVSSSNQVDKPKANDINDNEEDFQGFDPPAEDDLCKKFIKALNEIIESIPRKADDSADLDLQRKSDESDVKPKGYIINEAESNAVVNISGRELTIDETSFREPIALKKEIIREAKSKPGPCGTDQMPSISCSKLSAAQKEEELEPMDTDDKDVFLF